MSEIASRGEHPPIRDSGWRTGQAAFAKTERTPHAVGPVGIVSEPDSSCREGDVVA